MTRSEVKTLDKTVNRGLVRKVKESDLANAIRGGMKKRAKNVAEAQIPHFQLIAGTPESGAAGGSELGDVVIDITSDNDGLQDNTRIIEGRAPSVKRKSLESGPSSVPTKLAAIPVESPLRKTKQLNYVGVKKVPSAILQSGNHFRMVRKQRSPYYNEKIPATNNPFLTKDHILHRAIIPPIPTNTPAVTITRDGKKKKKEDKTKKGGALESDFIPYNENIGYEYYDDPNELCDRLRLLVASRFAGNSNHSHEINLIIAELRESGYVV